MIFSLFYPTVVGLIGKTEETVRHWAQKGKIVPRYKDGLKLYRLADGISIVSGGLSQNN